jgi:uncharacterized membrane protein YfcA
LDPLSSALLVLLGLFAGFLGGLLGVGGGIIVVPILILAFDLRAQQAVGTSLVMIIFTAISSTYAYSKQKRLDWKVAMMSALVTAPGAALGAYLTQFFSSNILTVFLAIFLFFISAFMIRKSYATAIQKKAKVLPSGKTTPRAWKRKITDAYGNTFQYDASIYTGLALLFVGGLASGFFGIGGGLIVVPILASVVGLPMHIAVATSMLTMIFTSVSGVATHVMLGHVLLEYTAPTVVGIVIGAQLGARTAKRLRSVALERVFAIVVFVIAIMLIVTRY